jgi:type II secretory pathway pseudopilin PulG
VNTIAAQTDDNEAGLSLIELIVAIVVTTIILAGIATILANSWMTQQKVVTVSEATNRGQLVGSAIERAMRNALYFEVSEGGTVLQVRTSLAGDLRCQGFRLTDGRAQMTTSSGALTTPNTTWPEWQSGIARRGTADYFAPSVDMKQLTYAFAIQTEASPVDFGARIALRSEPELESSPCWTP